MNLTVDGSCLCGAVQFTVTTPTVFCGHCHCSICRRSHGAAFVTWFGVPRDQFELKTGESWLGHYASSEHALRSFCSCCGSSLFSESSQHPGQIEIVLASMHGPIDRLPDSRVFFDHRADWDITQDALPKLGGISGFDPIEEKVAAA